MFGNLLSNILIEKLVVDGKLFIRPFSPEKLQVTQYPLLAREIHFEMRKNHPEEAIQIKLDIHNFEVTKEPFIFQPNEYVIVVVKEQIVLPDGIVARFIPQSRLIESGFGLFAGKLDPHYGNAGEQIRFGLVNLWNRRNKYDYGSPLAYIQFFDIRGLPVRETKPTNYDKEIKNIRRAEYIAFNVEPGLK